MSAAPFDWLLVSNPNAGHGSSNLESIENQLAKREQSFKTIEADSLSRSIQELHSALLDSSPERGIIVLGGDGTIHHVVNLIAALGLNIPIGVIPLGTGNDFARQCGLLGKSITTLIDVFNAHEPVTMDLIKVNEKFCLQVLSTGFDARVSATSLRMPRFLGKTRYVLSLLLELIRFEAIDYQLIIDGETRQARALMISLANGRNYGGGMRISPFSDHQDGIFELIIIHPVSRFTLLRVFPRIYSGTHINHPAIEVIQVRDLEIRAPTLSQGDGEAISEEGIPLIVKPVQILSWKL